MHNSNYVGVLRSLDDLPAAGDAFHRAGLVLLLEGDVIAPCGRGTMVAISGDECAAQVVGAVLLVWGTSDAKVAERLALGQPRAVYVGPSKPGRKTKAALAKLSRAGVLAVAVGSEVSSVARVSCDAGTAGAAAELTAKGWVSLVATPKKPTPIEPVPEPADQGEE